VKKKKKVIKMTPEDEMDDYGISTIDDKKDDDGSETEEEPVYPILSRHDSESDSTDPTVVLSRNSSGVESAVLASLPDPSLSRHSSAESLGSLRYSPSQADDEPPKTRSFAFDANRVFPGLFGTPKTTKPLFGML
jgi:hypothetical protein